MWPNKPESCVDVVEETTIDLSCADAIEGQVMAAAIANEKSVRRVCIG
jgi:hypothetical protein